jgi:putative transposase
MTRDITPAGSPATRAVDESFAEVRASFDRFCLAAQGSRRSR